MKIISVAGARPNFMKIAPIHKELKKYQARIDHKICHTGQHFDENMSKIFFEDLELPKPDFHLGVGSGSHAEQTAKIMLGFEKVLSHENPDLVIVVGDVNSTLACSLVSSKLNVPVAHVEAGLRSFDKTMPEEINRRLTDILSSFLFVTEESGLNNLKNEGFTNILDLTKAGLGENKNIELTEPLVAFVGDVMIDSLMHYMPKIESSPILEKLKLEKEKYIVVTFHRPKNVDSSINLQKLVTFLNNIGEKRKVFFPVHPRTRLNLKSFGLENQLSPNVIVSDPIGYIDFLALTKNAELVITDSGGIQEETTFLRVPCLTARDNTERPITVTEGTNSVAGTDLEKVEVLADSILEGSKKRGKIPPLWDGKASERIVQLLWENSGK